MVACHLAKRSTIEFLEMFLSEIELVISGNTHVSEVQAVSALMPM